MNNDKSTYAEDVGERRNENRIEHHNRTEIKTNSKHTQTVYGGERFINEKLISKFELK